MQKTVRHIKYFAAILMTTYKNIIWTLRDVSDNRWQNSDAWHQSLRPT